MTAENIVKNKLKQDSDFRKLALAFFDGVDVSKKMSAEEAREVMRKGSYRVSEGWIFDLKLIQPLENTCIQRSLRLLGPDLGNKKDISALIWKAALDEGEPEARLKSLIENISSEYKEEIRVFLPCFSVALEEGVEAISIGAVTVRRTSDVAEEIGAYDERWTVSPEAGPKLIFEEKKAKIPLSKFCWEVKLITSPGNAKSEASWLIFTALSLLRLVLAFEGGGPLIPNFGDVEADPVAPPKIYEIGLTIKGTAASFGGWAAPKMYTLTVDDLERLKGKKLDDLGRSVHSAKSKTLAQQISQGLGWMTRGRLAELRSERFLFYFTALEALLSDDNKNSPVVQTIARRSATIMSPDPKK